ncbi:hypothetical protein TNCT_28181 [Trichonephila clavata]|uniref:Uncharacterized protein n=2 Tax=Trichonephila clavata TaxID=2740835 RepID=A0A8X6G1D7_TRICU|nr:hypothetical protein TNCT_28181 [Trichonephila clavata]
MEEREIPTVRDEMRSETWRARIDVFTLVANLSRESTEIRNERGIRSVNLKEPHISMKIYPVRVLKKERLLHLRNLTQVIKHQVRILKRIFAMEEREIPTVRDEMRSETWRARIDVFTLVANLSRESTEILLILPMVTQPCFLRQN